MPLCLVLQHADKLPPCRITDGQGQPPVLEHSTDVQRLQGQIVVVLDQRRGDLVQQILSHIPVLGVKVRHQRPLPTPAHGRPLGSPAQDTLGVFQALEHLAQGIGGIEVQGDL